MKVLLDIQESKVPFVMELLNNFDYVKTQKLSKKNEEILDEITEIQNAFQHAALIKNGNLTARPVEELLNEL